jgi:hypothetical protein
MHPIFGAGLRRAQVIESSLPLALFSKKRKLRQTVHSKCILRKNKRDNHFLAKVPF